jgi:XrtJ-associated TM-motif-TM protein
MNKTLLLVSGFAFLLCVASPLFAQGGCVNSPENPTVVLALVGSAGAALATIRTRRAACSKSGKKRG